MKWRVQTIKIQLADFPDGDAFLCEYNRQRDLHSRRRERWIRLCEGEDLTSMMTVKLRAWDDFTAHLEEAVEAVARFCAILEEVDELRSSRTLLGRIGRFVDGLHVVWWREPIWRWRFACGWWPNWDCRDDQGRKVVIFWYLIAGPLEVRYFPGKEDAEEAVGSKEA